MTFFSLKIIIQWCKHNVYNGWRVLRKIAVFGAQKIDSKYMKCHFSTKKYCLSRCLAYFFIRNETVIEVDRWMVSMDIIYGHYICTQILDKSLGDYWFLQDNALCHTVYQTIQFLQGKFPRQMFSKEVKLTAHPDLQNRHSLTFLLNVN